MIYFNDRASSGLNLEKKYKKLIIKTINKCTELAEKDKNSEISVSIVGKEEIQALNKRYRDKDDVTDVLTFVMDENSDDALGDIVICYERAMEQAEEFEHSQEREIAFLAAHGAFHLYGYDHENETDEAVMNELQENALTYIGLSKSSKPKRKFAKILLAVCVVFFVAAATTTFAILADGGFFAPTEKPTVETETPTVKPSAKSSPSPDPTVSPATAPPTFKNILTGEMLLDEAVANRRPIAVVFSNEKRALPQIGLSQASLMYEVLAEGDVTRIIAIFQDFDAEQLCSLRSARHYFMYFAYDNDAILVHHGASRYAYDDYIRRGKIDYFDGQDLEGSMFWRDPARISSNGHLHSSSTSYERIFAQIEKKGYRKEKSEEFEGMFQFYDEPTSPTDGIESGKINISHIYQTKSEFVYNPKDKKYYKSHSYGEHIDGATGEQIGVTNVIVQLAIINSMNDEAGRRDVKLVSSGKGYLATNGVYVPINWSKASESSPTVWTFADGSPLTLNVGQTWINVVASDRAPVFEEKVRAIDPRIWVH